MKNTSMEPKAKEIIDFWFLEEHKPLHYKKDPGFDNKIREKFLDLWEEGYANGGLPWKKTPYNVLAMIILFDQFSRNMFRDTPKSFSSDPLALELSKYALENKLDENMEQQERHYTYIPHMHSEVLEDQEKSLILFNHQKYAVMHYDIIKQFGRFPHRNKTLGRESTPEELRFLTQPGSSF